MIRGTVDGHVGQDPEVRHTNNGTTVLRLRLASNSRSTRKKVDDKWVDQATWISVDFVGKRAEALAGIIKKGMWLVIDGELYERVYARKDGTEGKCLDMRADDVRLPPQARDRGAAPRARPEFDHDHTYTQAVKDTGESFGDGGYETGGEDIPF